MAVHTKDEQDIGSIVGQLQRELRQCKRALALLLAGMVAIVCSGSGLLQDEPSTITAREGFALRDKDGRIRAYLGFDSQSHRVGLALFDEKGHARAELGLSGKMDDYGLYIRDDRDHDRVHTGFRDGDYCFGLYDANKKNRLAIGQRRGSGDSGLSVIDERGVVRLGLGHMIDTGAGSKVVGLAIVGPDKSERISLYDHGDSSNVRISGKRGKWPRISLDVDNGDDVAHFSMLGSGAQRRVAIDVDPNNRVGFEVKGSNDRTINILDPAKQTQRKQRR